VGSLHPNKRGSTFRDLVAGSSAFNAVSRSSLLLAEHPLDETRRVLLRGKGNLSAAPSAVEFAIEGAKFRANGYDFDVPRAAKFTTADVSLDELVDQGSEKTAERSKITEAVEVIEELLPRDGDWHSAASVYEACEAEDIGKDSVKRAKRRLGLEHRRASTFQAPSEWRWPQSAPHGASAQSAPSAPSAPCAETLNNYTQCTQSTQSSESTSAVCATSAIYGPLGDEDPPHGADSRFLTAAVCLETASNEDR
jgi:hypothetical protein